VQKEELQAESYKKVSSREKLQRQDGKATKKTKQSMPSVPLPPLGKP
jgi:hypothetical protein